MAKLTLKGNKLTVEVDLTPAEAARLSSTGKTRLVASETDKSLTFNGHPLRVQINATIPPAA